MNGDQNNQTPGGDFPRPGDNPPSLTEPGKAATTPAQPPVQINPRSSLRSAGQEPSRQVPRRSATASVPAPALVAAPEPAASAGSSNSAPVPEEAGFYHPDTRQLSPPTDNLEGTAAPTAQRLASAAANQAVGWTSSGESLRGGSAAWRVRMSLASVVAGALIFLVTRDLVPTIAVVVAGCLFGFLGSRQPPSLTYHLDADGITIGQKRYSYAEFRAFSLVDYPAAGANLVPLKRFLPMLSIHFDSSQQDKIVSVLSNHLPMEQATNDAIDKLISKVRF
jgi:hypothetical protein